MEKVGIRAVIRQKFVFEGGHKELSGRSKGPLQAPWAQIPTGGLVGPVRQIFQNPDRILFSHPWLVWAMVKLPSRGLQWCYTGSLHRPSLGSTQRAVGRAVQCFWIFFRDGEAFCLTL